MAHSRSFPSSCEIVEIDDDELFMSEHTENGNWYHSRSEMRIEDRGDRSLGSNPGRISSLEDDLNQLFEIFNRRASAQGMKHSMNILGASGSSPRSAISDRVNLKQALRGLCISQASEMAAIRRSAKSARSSESGSGRIRSMYHNVVVEETKSVISEDTLPKNGKIPKSDARGSQASKAESSSSPLSLAYPSTPKLGSSSSTETDSMTNIANSSSPGENMLFSSSTEHAHQRFQTGVLQKERHAPIPPSGSPSSDADIVEPDQNMPRQDDEVIPAPRTGRSQTPKKEVVLLHEKGHRPPPYYPDSGSFWGLNGRSPPYGKPVRKESTGKSSKLEEKGSALKGGQNRSKEAVSSGSLLKGNKANKPTRSTSYLVKPGTKTKGFVKRKTNKGFIPYIHTDVNKDTHPGPNQIVCPRCQCIVTDSREEGDSNSSGSAVASNGAEINTVNAVSDAGTPCFTSDSSEKSKEVIETKGYSKSRDKREFFQSSRSSPGECSSSTSISEESNLSRPSYCDRPHMSKDVRWEAICRVKMQHGALGLRHFNLLKKLGCGDIGTVYLAELMGTECLFAIKVMDNDFLVRRKKISRAQTEREILRMLDHPFLPTLYSQFTSDNLSCLVMEYCPGGDLHVLRQKQPGRCFTEEAARFYVAEVLLALEYLHMLGVVYRDLKPENILVREDGHIMLSDFDLSLRCAVYPMLLVSSSLQLQDTTKRVSGPFTDSSGCAQPFCIEPSCQVSCFSPAGTKPGKLNPESAVPLLVAEPTTARSNSFVGTHEYLAPEIIKGEGHGSAVDWWTFGIFLYELLYGRTPFKGSGNDETLANVVMETLKFPDSPFVSLQARDLIAALLVKEPENRLGTERGAAEIKQHPFFHGLNWALIRCASPPQLPADSKNLGPSSHEKKGNSKYLQYNKANSTSEHLEFEVF
ncbi:hypothetical protein Dimus_034734 [Dionaea muscipula]